MVFTALTLAPQTAVCYYMMLAQWVSPGDRVSSGRRHPSEAGPERGAASRDGLACGCLGPGRRLVRVAALMTPRLEDTRSAPKPVPCPAQYLTPFDRALQVVTAALLHTEFLVALYAVRRGVRPNQARAARPAGSQAKGRRRCPAPPPQMARMLRLQRQQYYLFEAALQQQADATQWRARQQRLREGDAAAG